MQAVQHHIIKHETGALNDLLYFGAAVTSLWWCETASIRTPEHSNRIINHLVPCNINWLRMTGINLSVEPQARHVLCLRSARSTSSWVISFSGLLMLITPRLWKLVSMISRDATVTVVIFTPDCCSHPAPLLEWSEQFFSMFRYHTARQSFWCAFAMPRIFNLPDN